MESCEAWYFSPNAVTPKALKDQFYPKPSLFSCASDLYVDNRYAQVGLGGIAVLPYFSYIGMCCRIGYGKQNNVLIATCLQVVK